MFRTISLRSLLGLNAVNFFLGAVGSALGPFLAVYLKQVQWSYSKIGIATAIVGLGSLIFQIPAGHLCDTTKHPLRLLGISLLILAVIFFALPYSTNYGVWIDTSLFVAGAITALFYPMLITLAMLLTKKNHFALTMGQNQSWNHAGAIVFALVAIVIIKMFGIASIFTMTGLLSIFAIISSTLIPPNAIQQVPKRRLTSSQNLFQKVFRYLRYRPTAILIAAVLIYQIANAPLTPLIGLYIKHLVGNDGAVAWAVLITQVATIPASIVAGHYGAKFSQKLLLLTFVVLPIRIFICSITINQTGLLATQIFDGIAAGAQGVIIPIVCSDLIQGKGELNLFVGVVQTAVAIGSFIGSLCLGFLTDIAGFRITLVFFMIVAMFGVLCLTWSQAARLESRIQSS